VTLHRMQAHMRHKAQNSIQLVLCLMRHVAFYASLVSVSQQ